MKTTFHKIINTDSKILNEIPDKSIALVVTSPPYPMIEMWDSCFAAQDHSVKKALDNIDAITAFEKMHILLDNVWAECDRVLIDNGFICINIGDATRTINSVFQLFSNHSKIINFFIEKGYCVLPDIIWRKQSNSPNKFMGSGMYPAGAYVTYEHEYILIFRKGGKRVFDNNQKKHRQKSAYFWEERNVWFSDLWNIKGTSQNMKQASSRNRSAAFPFEIPYRLINMYSIKGDTVLDPFLGTGTTMLASIASERNSIGVEIDKEICKNVHELLISSKDNLNSIINHRLNSHINFIQLLPLDIKEKCYENEFHQFPVKTRQEIHLQIQHISTIEKTLQGCICKYYMNQ